MNKIVLFLVNENCEVLTLTSIHHATNTDGIILVTNKTQKLPTSYIHVAVRVFVEPMVLIITER